MKESSSASSMDKTSWNARTGESLSWWTSSVRELDWIQKECSVFGRAFSLLLGRLAEIRGSI